MRSSSYRDSRRRAPRPVDHEEAADLDAQKLGPARCDMMVRKPPQDVD